MPRNGSGVMSKPPNTTAQPNTTIRSAMFNSVVDDLIQDANNPRPITAGGTGAATIEAMRAAFEIDRKTVFIAKSSNYTAVKDDNGSAISVSATATMALTSAATLGISWHALFIADGGIATIDPAGSEKINGALTLVLQDGQAAFVISTGITGDEFTAIVFSSSQQPYSEKSANYTALPSDNRSIQYFTASATLALTAAATLGADFRMRVVAGGGQVVIDPNASELINGALSIVLQQGQEALLICTGTAFRALIYGDPRSGPQLQGYSFGLGLSINATDTANDVDIAVGSAAADTSPYYLMQLATALTKRIDAAWVVGNNAGGLDTGAIAAAGTYYLWLIQRSDTLVTDALFSLSATAPTMPANYDRKRLIGRLDRASSVNGGAGSLLGSGMLFVGSYPLSGVATAITGLPANIKRLIVELDTLGVSAAALPVVQLRNAGGAISTGYDSQGAGMNTGGGVSSSASTAGMMLLHSAVAGSTKGEVTIQRNASGGGRWTATGITKSSQAILCYVFGELVLTGDLTGITITTAAGTATLSGNVQVWAQL